MREINLRFFLSFLGTSLLAVGVIFLPRHFSQRLDQSNFDQVHLRETDQFSFLETADGDLLDIVSALQKISSDTVTLVSSVADPGKTNSELIDEVFFQVLDAKEMYPWIYTDVFYETNSDYTAKNMGGDDESFMAAFGSDYVKYARYYSLIYPSDEDSNVKCLMNFWLLRYSDEKNFDYYLMVDAKTYQIYYAEIYNEFTELLYQSNKESLIEVSDIKLNSKVEKIEQNYSSELFYDTGVMSSVGCQKYYQADDAKFVYQGYGNRKISMTVLTFGQTSVYIEESMMSNISRIGYHGISVGFNNLSEKVHRLMN